jgi:hypothetical protein
VVEVLAAGWLHIVEGLQHCLY